MNPVKLVLLVGLLACAIGCTSKTPIERVEEFSRLRESDLDKAQEFLSDDPRVWYGERQGDGRPWNLHGQGMWSDWDTHFQSAGEILKWETGPNQVASIHSEMNDYFRLLDRNGSWYRKTWFFDNAGRIEGYMISDWEDAPPTHDSGDDFRAWASEAYPDEWAYLRPEGQLDPSGDRAARTRVLLVAWRQVAGLTDLALESPEGHQMAFWRSLQLLCGRSFEGSLVEINPPDASFEGQRYIMQVRRCDENEIRIPFHVGSNRSRTWVLTRNEHGLQLKHDHRHEDGSEDDITQYGGTTRDAGTAHAQEFHVDEFTARLIPAAATNVWSMELTLEKQFAYALRREGTERRFRVEFDLSAPVGMPAPPWGH